MASFEELHNSLKKKQKDNFEEIHKQAQADAIGPSGPRSTVSMPTVEKFRADRAYRKWTEFNDAMMRGVAGGYNGHPVQTVQKTYGAGYDQQKFDAVEAANADADKYYNAYVAAMENGGVDPATGMSDVDAAAAWQNAHKNSYDGWDANTRAAYDRYQYAQIPKSADFLDYTGNRPVNPTREQTADRIVGEGDDRTLIKGQAIADPVGLYLNANVADISDAMSMAMEVDGLDAYGSVIQRGQNESWGLLKDPKYSDLLDTYYYLLNKEGMDSAMKYMDSIAYTLQRDATQKATEEYRKEVRDANLAEKIMLSASTLAAQTIGGGIGFVDNMIRTVQGKETNPYSAAHSLSNYSQTVRSEVSNEIDKATGFIDEQGRRTNKKGLFGGNFTWGSLYQSAMSTGDMLINAPLGGKVYGLLMGMGASESAAKELYEKGASNGQIFWGSMMSGAIEMLTEKYSMESLINIGDSKTVIAALWNTAKQGFTEGSEEFFSEIGNAIFDLFNMKDKSDIMEMYNENGQDVGKTIVQLLQQAGDAFLGGFFSGAMSGGAKSFFGTERTDNGQRRATGYLPYVQQFNAEGAAIRSSTSGVQGLYDMNAEMNSDSTYKDSEKARKAAEAETKRKVEQAYRNRGKLQGITEMRANIATGRMLDSISEGYAKASSNEIAAKLTNAGMKKSEADKTAPAIAARINGTSMTNLQQEALEDALNSRNMAVRRVISEIITDSESQTIKGSERLDDYAKAVRSNITLKAQAAFTGTEEQKREKAKEAIGNDMKVSEDGKTIDNATGAEVSLDAKPIVMNDGKLELKLTNGSTVSASDLSFGSDNESLIFGALAKTGMNTDDANAVYQYLSSINEADLPSHAAAVVEAYRFGAHGISTDNKALLGFSSVLPDTVRTLANNAGKTQYGSQQYKARQFRKGMGTVRYDGLNEQEVKRNANAQQRTAIRIAEFLAAAGFDIEIFESQVDERGNRVGENGQYVDGKIRIDLYAGGSGEGMMAYTIAHEATHQIEEMSPAEFHAYADSLFAALGEKGIDVNSKVIATLERVRGMDAYKGKSEDQLWNIAYSEVVAEATETMLTDTNAIENLSQRISMTDKTLWGKIKNVFSSIANRLREAYRNMKPDSDIARAARSVITSNENLVDLWVKAAQNAMENFTEGQKEVQEAISGAESSYDSMYVRDGKMESATDFESELRQSTRFDADYMAKAMEMNKIVDADIMQKAMEDRATIRGILERLQKNPNIGMPEDVLGNTYIANSSYDGTEENTTICPRSLAQEAFMDAVSEYLGRPLTVAEQVYISQDLQGRTATPECLYCYVATDRKAYREFLGKYIQQRDAVLKKIGTGMDEKSYTAAQIEKLTPEQKKNSLYLEFLGDRKATKNMQKRYDMWLNAYKSGQRMIDSNDLASISKLMGDKAANFGADVVDQIKDALAYAQSASWAKKRVSYLAYNNHILKWNADRIKKLNSHYGLRMYSFSDYSPAFILENMQMITDASVRGLKMLAYTKEMDFAKIFASTGMNINISCFGFESGGNVYENNIIGAKWEEAQQLRRDHDNVGVTFVATSDKLVEWALAQEWIDVVIPYHLVRTGAEVAEALGYKNYTSESGDGKAADWKEWSKGKSKKSLVTSISPVMHNNDKATYMKALEEHHLTPRFARWVDNPNYMKLVNECRRSASESTAVQPVFDVDAAKESLAKMEATGYYTPIGGDMDTMYEIAGKLGDEIMGGAAEGQKNNTAGGDAMYSYRGVNADGIEVYETSEETLQLPWKERKKKYLHLIRNEYRGRTAKFVRNGHAYYAEFDRKNATKPIYGEQGNDRNGRDALVNTAADGDIFELVENAKYDGSKVDEKDHFSKDGFTEYFDYFVKTVQIDGIMFDIRADVKKQYYAEGGYTYTLTLTENKTANPSPRQGARPLNLSDNGLTVSPNVPQPSDSVKLNSSRETSDFDVDWLDALDIDDIIKELEESLNAYTEKKQRAPRRVDEVKKQLRKIGLEFNGTKTASWTDDHLKKVMEISSASNPKYAQAYVVYMKPIDYLNLTAGGNTNTMERIQNESADYGDLDMSKVGEIYLTIGNQKDSDGDGTARVYGHEGRHRMMLLGKAGFEKVPVMVFNSDNKYSKDYLWNLTLKPQKFGGEYFVSDTRSVTVTDAVPLSRDYESLAKAMYGSDNESADVLYSERQQGADDSKQIEKLKKDVSDLRELVKLQGKLTGGTMATQASITKQTNRLLRMGNSAMDKVQLSKELNAFYHFLATDKDYEWEDVRQRADTIAAKIIKEQKPGQMDGYAREVLTAIRGTTVRLTDEQKRIAVQQYGNLSNFRKALHGFVNFSDNAKLEIDSAWSEWAEEYPSIFDAGTVSGDQAIALADAIEDLRNTREQVNVSELREALTEQIYDSYWDLTTVQTVADKWNRKLNESEGKWIEKMTELKERHAERIQEVREQRDRKIQQIKDHNAEVNARYKDRTLRTQKRHQVWKTAQELERLLSKPTKGKYVPKELVTSVIEVMETLDLETGKNDKRNLQLSKLESIYKRMKGDSDYAIYHNEVIEKMLNELTQTIGDTSIMDMSIEQLDDIHTALKALKHTISEATKVRIGKEEHDAYEMSVKMTRETESARVMKHKLLRKWTLSMLRPQAAFERFGGYAKDNTWSRVFTLLNDGQLKQTRLTMEGQQIFAELLQDQKSLDKLISTKKGDLVDIGLKDRNGETVEITRGMMLSIYMHLQNEDNMRHFARGGVTVPELKAYYGGKYKDAFGIGRHETAAVGENGVKDVLAKINGYMDDYDRAWVKAAQKFFDGFSKDTVNAATMEMYGFKKASVDKYFPIRTDPNYRAHNFESISMDMSLENAGFMKDRVHASNPILLEDITDVVNSQITRVAQYAAIAPAIMQFNKVYSKVQTEFAGSIQSAVTSKFGNEGKQYIENVIADIQGARKADRNIFDELRGAQAAAVLTLSVRTTLAQAASYPSAAAIVGKKALAKAFMNGGKDGRMISRADKELIAKYSPLLWLRMQGYFDTDMGNIKDSKVDKVMKKMRWLTGWIQAMDGATVGRLWYAAEYYVQDNHSDLQQGTDAYYEEVAKVFNKIVEETQPDYTTMQRPDILRNPHALVKQLTMYMTQRLQNTNIMYDATQRAIRYQQDFKAGRNGVTAEDVHDARSRMMGAYLSQMVAAATIVAFKGLADILMHSVNPYRDKDKELTLESVSLAVLDAFADTMIGNVLWGSQIYDYAKSALLGEKYYGISLSGVEVVQDLLEYSIALIQKPNLNNAEKLAKRIYTSMALPIENAKKIVSAFYLHGKDIANGEFFSFEAGVERSKTIEEHRFTKAAVAGDKAKAESIDLTTSERQKGVQNSFEEGEITDAQAARILADYCDLSAPEAKNLVEFWKWKAKVGDAAKGWDVKAYTKYMEYGDSVGISLEMWNRHKAAVSGLSADKDENGKSISGSKKAKVLEAINSLPLTAKQKDSLYYAEGYSAKDIDEAPWH